MSQGRGTERILCRPSETAWGREGGIGKYRGTASVGGCFVDPTDARNDILGSFGRSHRSAQALLICPPERIQRPWVNLIAAGVRRDGPGMGNRQRAMLTPDLPYRSSPSPLRQGSRETHILRCPTHTHAAHGPVNGPKQPGISTGSPRSARDASSTTAPSFDMSTDFGPVDP
jgi:hypothetical protein